MQQASGSDLAPTPEMTPGTYARIHRLDSFSKYRILFYFSSRKFNVEPHFAQFSFVNRFFIKFSCSNQIIDEPGDVSGGQAAVQVTVRFFRSNQLFTKKNQSKKHKLIYYDAESMVFIAVVGRFKCVIPTVFELD